MQRRQGRPAFLLNAGVSVTLVLLLAFVALVVKPPAPPGIAEFAPQASKPITKAPNSQSAVLIVTGLSPLEPGKTYQVWLIDGGAPVSAGLLTVNEEGQGVFIVTSEEAIGSFKSLGISIEPAGGSPQPTGEIVVLSDL